jgi:murein DD-endopeptidase MepM/ murein hydrolase activator NlpD
MRAFHALLAVLLIAAAPVKLEGSATQGGLMQGHAAPGSKVWQDERQIRVAPDGRYLIGFAHDAGPRAEIKIEEAGGETELIPVAVATREYAVEKIDHLPPSQVTPDEMTLQRIAAERVEVTGLQTKASDTPMFAHPFAWPVTGIVSGTYGSARILNGEPRAPHLGVDVAAPEGTPILAPSEGVVILVGDQFLTGITVMLDHGLGLTSLYAHLSRVGVKVGDKVSPGAVLGAVGATGRATAPNLHWGVHLNGVALDPALLAGPMPQSQSQ